VGRDKKRGGRLRLDFGPVTVGCEPACRKKGGGKKRKLSSVSGARKRGWPFRPKKKKKRKYFRPAVPGTGELKKKAPF